MSKLGLQFAAPLLATAFLTGCVENSQPGNRTAPKTTHPARERKSKSIPAETNRNKAVRLIRSSAKPLTFDRNIVSGAIESNSSEPTSNSSELSSRPLAKYPDGTMSKVYIESPKARAKEFKVVLERVRLGEIDKLEKVFELMGGHLTFEELEGAYHEFATASIEFSDGSDELDREAAKALTEAVAINNRRLADKK